MPLPSDLAAFVEVGSNQRNKSGMRVAGDTFVSRRSRNGERTVAVLSDGLGSGIKAGVLSTLTATMALNLIERDVPIQHVAKVVMETLPVCRTRQISYSTFTIVDITADGAARVIEYDNPPYVWMRGSQVLEPQREVFEVRRPHLENPPTDGPASRPATVHFSQLQMEVGDRLVFCSDGVTQSGMGTRAYPLGWGREALVESLVRTVGADPLASASSLARRVVRDGLKRDAFAAKDDISSAVLYVRSPRRLLLVSGPPLDEARDGELAALVRDFDGTTVVAGGTTGNIVARELGRVPEVMIDESDGLVPPSARMEGVDLMSEGIITLARTAELLEVTPPGERCKAHAGAATQLVNLLLESDSVECVIGTRINQAHQDPNAPQEIEIRRTTIRRIALLLRNRFLKRVSVTYF